RDGRQPSGSGLPQQPGRLSGREHAPDREGGDRVAASHRARRRAAGAAAHSRIGSACGAASMTTEKTNSLHQTLAELPSWFPSWASKLAELYFSGTTAAFVL